MKFSVKSRHIRQAKASEGVICPVEFALSAAVGEPCYVGKFWCGAFNRHRVWAIPLILRNYIDKYDAGEEIQPETFSLDDNSFDSIKTLAGRLICVS